MADHTERRVREAYCTPRSRCYVRGRRGCADWSRVLPLYLLYDHLRGVHSPVDVSLVYGRLDALPILARPSHLLLRLLSSHATGIGEATHTGAGRFDNFSARAQRYSHG